MSLLHRIKAGVKRRLGPGAGKQETETAFWFQAIQNQMAWYRGERVLHTFKPPAEGQKVRKRSAKDSAVLTWMETHQKPKYLEFLSLPPDSFRGEKVLDVGAGPMPSATAFEGCELYCLDALYHKYLEAGFPLHYFDNVRFVHGHAEDMPIEDSMFDAVISVNAIDHMDDFRKTATEIRRVLKDGGKLAIHAHYHKATTTEPIEIDDDLFMEAFGWCKGLRKVPQPAGRFDFFLKPGESFNLWSNMHR
ncbi:MAG: class I SAM-dependent methyltransferase [Nitrospirae bacterium]|nr:class I SAM-dependent methyltransferase [Nitrospirota bacterium]MBI5696866.1 class I SAM-dependent methyltransferase [Nitrospirota bacterium]